MPFRSQAQSGYDAKPRHPCVSVSIRSYFFLLSIHLRPICVDLQLLTLRPSPPDQEGDFFQAT